MSFVLVYFRGCPNAEIAMELLKDVGIEYTIACQDDLPPGHELREYSSPTLLENGEVVFGGRNAGAEVCTLGIPSERELLERIYGESPKSS